MHRSCILESALINCFCKLHNEPHTIETSVRMRFGRCACASARPRLLALARKPQLEEAAAWVTCLNGACRRVGATKYGRVWMGSPSKELSFGVGSRFAGPSPTALSPGTPPYPQPSAQRQRRRFWRILV